MIKSILAATAISLAALSTASAAPAGTAAAQFEALSGAPVLQVQYRRDRHERREERREERRDEHRWVPGHRYDRAPPNWRRYHERPRDWRRRGCVLVGPIWFCP